MPALSLRTLVLSIAASAMSLPAMAFGIGLQPTTVEIQVEPGERNRQIINIGNVHTEQTISLTLGLADWALDEAGQIELSPPGEAASSAANWARFSPAFLTLKPGESTQVIVDMATPSRLNRSGDFRFALLASTILPEERDGQSGVWKKYQIATLFYLTTGPAKSDPQITSSQVVSTESGINQLELKLENPGNAHARLQGVIEIGGGLDPETVNIANLVVLHDADRNYVTRLPEGTPLDAEISVKLDNTFAPQANSGRLTLPPYRVPTESRHAEVAVEADAESLP